MGGKRESQPLELVGLRWRLRNRCEALSATSMSCTNAGESRPSPLEYDEAYTRVAAPAAGFATLRTSESRPPGSQSASGKVPRALSHHRIRALSRPPLHESVSSSENRNFLSTSSSSKSSSVPSQRARSRRSNEARPTPSSSSSFLSLGLLSFTPNNTPSATRHAVQRLFTPISWRRRSLSRAAPLWRWGRLLLFLPSIIFSL